MKKNVALLLFAFVLAAASLGAFSAAAPIVLAAALLSGVNALSLAAGFGMSPVAWNLYTAICGFRGALMLGSAAVLRGGAQVALSSLGREYAVVSLLIFAVCAVVEYRRVRVRRARRSRAGA